MTGVIITLIISGQSISRTGRYRIFPIMGTALAAVGLALLATVEPATPTPVLLAYLLLLGFGIGMTMQVMMLVAQNGAPQADLGTATSTVTFLRQIGASAGVAVVGAMITLRFTEGLPRAVVERLPGGVGGLSADRLGMRCPAICRPPLPRPTEPRSRRSSATWHRSSVWHFCWRSHCQGVRYATPRTPTQPPVETTGTPEPSAHQKEGTHG